MDNSLLLPVESTIINGIKHSCTAENCRKVWFAGSACFGWRKKSSEQNWFARCVQKECWKV
jgi:hypothetical protein